MSDAAGERACVDGGAVLDRLTMALRTAGVPFTHTHHQAVFTSAEAAAIRGVSLHSGAKALIMKGAEDFVLVVLPADMALDSGALRDFLGCKRLRFATREEVLQLTGLTPGSIPPFGSLFKLPTVCDPRLADNETINFNAGSHTDSFQMTFAAYVAHESPTLAAVAKASA